MQKWIETKKTPGDHLFCATRIKVYHKSRNSQKQESLSPRKTPYVQSSQSFKGRGKSSGSAPSADTVSDTTERLEVVPARELVVFRGGRHVRADDADGEVWDFGDGDFSAVELWCFESANILIIGEIDSNAPSLPCTAGCWSGIPRRGLGLASASRRPLLSRAMRCLEASCL